MIDSELDFVFEDIPDNWSFGNGTSIGSILLKDGRKIGCGWIVFDHAAKAAADGLLKALRNIFKKK